MELQPAAPMDVSDCEYSSDDSLVIPTKLYKMDVKDGKNLIREEDLYYKSDAEPAECEADFVKDLSTIVVFNKQTYIRSKAALSNYQNCLVGGRPVRISKLLKVPYEVKNEAFPKLLSAEGPLERPPGRSPTESESSSDLE